MTHGALFNGIAGFPLAAAWAGIPTDWTVEIDPFCNQVSKKHFPHATQYTDIRECQNLPYVDIISGGFPCQPFSVAGKQLGNEDDRALWPEMLRIIREVKPTYVIGENVPGIISLALDYVLASLEDEGYTTETFVLPAASVGAPHKRYRVWIVACSDYRQRQRQEKTICTRWDAFGFSSEVTSNPHELGLRRKSNGVRKSEFVGKNNEINNWSDFPTQSPVRGGNDGFSRKLDMLRLKALGNAIVPQVAYEIFKAILALPPSP